MNSEHVQHSVELILKYQDISGAYPASPNFDNYKFCWFRDGSFIADAMSRAGQVESANRFFDWCAGIITSRKEKIENGGTLDARFTYDGHEVPGEWGSYQLDGYGIWLWSLKNHSARHNLPIEKYLPATDLTQNYLALHWQEDCFDWWEERKGVFAATRASIYAGLKAFNNPLADQVQASININHERLDASWLACLVFEAVDNETFAPHLADMESKLVSPAGGVYRHLEDIYYGGGTWPILSCLLGLTYLKFSRVDEAKQKLALVESLFDQNGWLPEQTIDHLLKPDEYGHWVDRWGPPANPLLWSHAMYITLATQL